MVDRIQVLAGFAQGKTYSELAEEFGVTRQRIHQIVKSDRPDAPKREFAVDGARLSEARIRAGFSMEQLCEAMGDGCKRSSISRCERGLTNPSDARIIKMAEILGTREFVVAVGKRMEEGNHE